VLSACTTIVVAPLIKIFEPGQAITNHNKPQLKQIGYAILSVIHPN
jgi:hypothetical protein